MQTRSESNNLKIAVTKVRPLVPLIKNKDALKALALLKFNPKKGAFLLHQALLSAVANAKNNYSLDDTNLYLREILVNEGPVAKRFKPRARGSADEILKRTSHITIILDERVKTADKKVTANILAKKKRDKEIAAKRLEQTEKEAKKMKAGDLTKLSQNPELEEENKKQLSELKQDQGRDEEGKQKKGFLNKLFRRKAE